MEIKNSLFKNIEPYRAKVETKEAVDAAAGRAKNAAQNPVAAQGDRVSLSASARLHTTAHAEAANAPEVRREMVDALKQRVDSGEYTVDSGKVAEKLVQSEALLARTLNGDTV
ncbi:MAG: flagellar biosynthesis anti-sigma factor FlgM [Desulfovibrionaceae bacterium]|nr:flagellar biosynthesis anti-sigma factor FlgM [Desulfovibrionaceae bacterium]